MRTVTIEKSEKVEHFLSLFGKKGVTKQYVDTLLKDMNNEELNQLIEEIDNETTFDKPNEKAKNYINSFKKVAFIPFYCPLLKRDIDFGYCTEIEYVATGIVNENFLVDGDNITQEMASKFCIGCTAEKNTNVIEID
jgi:hypothetical protein